MAIVVLHGTGGAMVVLLVLVVLIGWALWSTRPRPGMQSRDVPPRTPPALADLHALVVLPSSAQVRRARPARRFPGSPTLTEDDLIAFGLLLQTTDDVVGLVLGTGGRPTEVG